MPAFRLLLASVALLPCICIAAQPLQQIHQDFSQDPGWEGVNNRVEATDPPEIIQDFGYRPANHTGGPPGEIGGVVRRSRTAAWYAMPIGPLSFDSPLSASGTILIPVQAIGGAYFGFFNSTRQEWRPWSSLAIRVDRARGSNAQANLIVDYMSSTWRAAGYDAGLVPADGSPHRWSLTYDPNATVATEWPHPKLVDWLGTARVPEDQLLKLAQQDDPTFQLPALQKLLEEASYRGLIEFQTRRGVGWQRRSKPETVKGRIVFRVDDGPRATYFLDRSIRGEPLMLDRFGIFNFQLPGNATEFYLSNLTVNGKPVDLTKDPQWESHGNHARFAERDFHGKHDFGFSMTQHAGDAPGEIGGTFWRTEPIDPIQGYYADEVGKLTLDDPIAFSGHIAFTAGGTDAGAFFGYFNRAEKMKPLTDPTSGAPMPQSLGIAIEDPTRVGYYFSSQLCATEQRLATNGPGPVFLPDARKHAFTFNYDPAANAGVGLVTFTLDGQRFEMKLTKAQRATGCTFDRFGLMNLRRGGKYVELYLDDLTYTARRNPGEAPAHHEQTITKVPYPPRGRKY